MRRAAFIIEAPRTASLRALNYDQQVEALKISKGRKFRATPLNSLLQSLGASYSQVFTRLDCSENHGVELISQADMFAAEPAGRIIRRDSMPNSIDHEVQRWQLLIAGAGQMGEGNLFGRSIIADGRLTGKFLGGDAVDLIFKEPGGDLNLWTYAFLNTSLGMRAVRACAYGTSIPHMRLDLLGEVPIPLPEDEALLQRVAELVRNCVIHRELYLRELHNAREVIEDLPEMRTAYDLCAERKAHVVCWTGELPTLCAWNFASTGGALSYLSKEWSGRIGDAVAPEKIFRGGRYSRVACDPPFGVDLLSQRDVFAIRPMPRRIVLPNIRSDLIRVPTFSLLAGGQGTLGEGELFGQIALVTPDIASAAISEHLLRIQPRSHEIASLLYAYLSSMVGKRLLRSTGVGTKLLGLRPDLVLRLPLPAIDDGKLAAVFAHVTRATIARTTAVRCEAEAFQIIEQEVLPLWLA